MTQKPQKPAINNFAMKAVAVLFAIFLWFYVDVQQNPLADTALEVPVTYLNLNEAFTLSGAPDTVTVTIKGRRSIIDGLKSSDFQATVDLAQVSLGSNRLPVTVKSPLNVTVLSTSPARVMLEVDEMKESTFMVKAKVTGSAADGYTYATPSVEPAAVTINGGKGHLAQIAAVQVTINAANSTDNLVQTLPIQLLAADGSVINDDTLQVSPQSVDVFLPIDRETPSKWVTVRPTLSGTPQAGYAVNRIVTEPEQIKITGEDKVIAAINEIATTAVAVDGITGDVVREVTPVLPDGVAIAGESKIRVLVSIAESNVSRSLEVPIELRGLGENLTASAEPLTARLVINGSAEQVEAAQGENIRVFADLSGLALGTHSVPLALENNSALTVTQVTPANITVEITDEVQSVGGEATIPPPLIEENTITKENN